MSNMSVLIGSFGVGLLLLAFFLSLFKIIRQDTITYTLMNFTGAAISCWASLMIKYIPFVVLEAAWSVVAMAGFINVLLNRYMIKKKCNKLDF